MGPVSPTPPANDLPGAAPLPRGPGDCADVVRTLPPVPRSVEAVLRTLCSQAAMTGQELRESTGLPRRTIYEALRTLRGLGILRQRTSLRDSRQTYFWLQRPRLAAPGAQAAA